MQPEAARRNFDADTPATPSGDASATGPIGPTRIADAARRLASPVRLGHREASSPDPWTLQRLPFDDAFRDGLRALLRWRRDVRRFRRDPIPAGALERLLRMACLAPSVGLSQPWRFVVVDDPHRRAALRDLFARCNAEAASDYAGERAERYAALKLAGLDDAPVQVSVFADRETATGHGLGRRTMPEMVDYSVVVAIHTLWLAARAEGIGLGWVSILDPGAVAGLLDVPDHWRFIGHLCIGYPERETDTPELEAADWERRRPGDDVVVRR